jgi:hypothetical protein
MNLWEAFIKSKRLGWGLTGEGRGMLIDMLLWSGDMRKLHGRSDPMTGALLKSHNLKSTWGVVLRKKTRYMQTR